MVFNRLSDKTPTSVRKSGLTDSDFSSAMFVI